jgi:hypothetical protein
MDSDWNEWVEDDEGGAGRRRRKRDKRGRGAEAEVDVEIDDDELAEWKQERGSRGRKPIDERRRRSRKDEDGEEF